ncbi:hypothetical protein Mapa_000662 [Marchantia paleacea]|nr:hypothetical protein Mapa_000662 [Marchantia paleacea]
MCVLQPCADPDGVGAWWRDDTCWKKYGRDHESQIRSAASAGLRSVDLGLIKSSVHPGGARYTANLKKMEQVAVSSGQVRPIKIIDGKEEQKSIAPKSPQLTLEPPPPPQSGPISTAVHYRDTSGALRQYDQDVATALLQAIVGRQSSLVFESSRTGRILHFDIPSMRQCFVDSERSVLDDPPVDVVIEVPWNPQAMLFLFKKADGVMIRKVLSLTVDQYRSEEYLNATLPGQAFPRKIISKSLDSEMKPGHPFYEGFLDALEANLTAFPDALESFMYSAVPTTRSCRNELSVVRTVFKPAPRKKNVLPSENKESSKMSFWSNMAAPLAAAHSLVYGAAIQLQIMVYLIITPKAELMEKSPACVSEVVQIKRQEHCLSLALLRVSCR